MAAATLAFAATNVDDLFLLVAWFAAGRYRARDIVAGQFLGIGALFVASVAAALLALAVPLEYVRWLGLVPIALGVKVLLFPDREAEADAPPAAGVLTVTTVTVANGADNLGVYIPVFATSTTASIGVWAVVFVLLIALWCIGARWLVRHPAAGAPLRRWGPRAVPWVLIALGLGILAGAL